MIEAITVENIYNRPGFFEMMEEYGQLSNPIMPPPASALSRKPQYMAFEKAGLMTVYCVMEGGKVVGFATCLKSMLPHYGVDGAFVDSLYLMKAHRRNGNGRKLIEACEDYARMEGLPFLFIQVHEEELDRLGIILERRTYSALIYSYGRRL